ncbi:acyl carrier protein 1 [Carex littledalei]|uniref:Acyl carrier protein n=1 Tax=Carex littledalei TaxID=544730 RepID=A0A833VCW6_9POAL|nr:acyl carrier protein 1 [Carex littledalei]
MASVSATSVSFGCSFNQTKSITASKGCSISLGTTNRRLSSLRFPRLRVYASAKPETVSKVMEIVKKQLALNDSVDLKPESKFSELGADSLDTVEIVMNLEEVFNITVEEDNSQNITTVQEAADLIEKLVADKPTEATSEASA